MMIMVVAPITIVAGLRLHHHHGAIPRIADLAGGGNPLAVG
jgi:hypothetical protein